MSNKVWGWFAPTGNYWAETEILKNNIFKIMMHVLVKKKSARFCFGEVFSGMAGIGVRFSPPQTGDAIPSPVPPQPGHAAALSQRCAALAAKLAKERQRCSFSAF